MALRELRIRDLAVVRETTINFDDGFLVLTGETGAGKSVCLHALSAALGGKADASVIRPGASFAKVAAVFDTVAEEVQDYLATFDVPVDELLTITREIGISRSVYRLNGALVSAGVVRSVAEKLIEITAQGVSASIYRHDWQRDLVDASGGPPLAQSLAVLRVAFKERKAALELLATTKAAAAGEHAELQRAQEIVEDLGPAGLQIDERDQLLAERLRLRHAAAIGTAAQGITRAINGDDGSLGAADILTRAMVEAQAVREVSPEVARILESTEQILAGLQETAREARSVAEETHVDQDRLSQVEERLDVIGRIERRYGSVEAAITELNEAQALLLGNAGGARTVAEAEDALRQRTVRLVECAADLRAMRRAAAKKLEKAVGENLKQLDLPHAKFRIEWSQTAASEPDGIDIGGKMMRCTADGVDDVEFRLATNRGALPMPLASGPSGGELSRLLLALGAVVAGTCPTVVLDEVDTGVGGETAARVGELLAAMGAHRQVVAITHRAEIAARASGHLRASKVDVAGGAETTVAAVDGQRRIEEMARLLSGRQTAAAQSRAAELLDEGRQLRAG